jgi:hypothetical protein
MLVFENKHNSVTPGALLQEYSCSVTLVLEKQA